MALGKGKQRLSIVLTDHQVDWIRTFAKTSDLSISQTVRKAINLLMKETIESDQTQRGRDHHER